MTVPPRERIERQFKRLERKVDAGEIHPDTIDAFRTYAETIDAAKPSPSAENPNGDTYACKPSTIEAYVRSLRLMAEGGVNPLFSDADEVNAFMADKYDSGEGASSNTMIIYQSALRSFYCVFDELGVDPGAIDTYSPDKTPRHDLQDLFTEEEVFAMRDAVGRSRNPTRNRAFLELLIFSLQRVNALLTLRVGDVDVENGAIYLNEEYDREQGGLKGAIGRGRHRSIYGARKYLRDWVRAHPTGEPDDWLFVGDPNNPSTSIENHWDDTTAYEMLGYLGKWAGVDKPTNPHNFRHYGITVLRWDYDVPWDEINAQAGVIKGSDMPRTTYNHVDDNDLRQKIEERMGLKEESQNRFAPVICPVCDEVLKSDWRKCPACNERFAPGEEDGREEMEWLADKAAMSSSGFKRAISRAVERELESQGHVESS